MNALRMFEARTFSQRLLGLLARPRLKEAEALVLAPCSSVHTFFMRYAIDVVFVRRDARVLKVVHRLEPWRWASCWRAHAAVELLAGQAQARGIEPGGSLEWRRKEDEPHPLAVPE
jgi:uncharacterized protein